MKHDTVMTRIYENEGLSFVTRLGIAFHILGCSRCSREIIRYEDARELMRTDFFDCMRGGGGAEPLEKRLDGQ